MGQVLVYVISDMVIVTVRFSSLLYFSKMSRVSLADAIYKPLRMNRSILLCLIICIVLLDYLLTMSTYGVYKPQLLDYNYYVEKGLLWGFPFKILYYLSEIIVMNYMYILAKNTWSFTKHHITSGTLFLILGWALLHIFAKNVLVAFYAVVLVILFYLGYEYTGSPLTPIILWFTVLIV